MRRIKVAKNQNSNGYASYREKWVHEDNLINHRLNWLLMTQTILFAAYGLLLGMDMHKSPYADKIEALIDALPKLGIGVGVLILLGIVGAVGAMYELRKNRTEQVREMDIDASPWTSFLGQLTGLLFPMIFIYAWIKIMGFG